MWISVKLGGLFSAILTLVFVAGVVVAGVGLSLQVQKQVQVEVINQAESLVAMMNGVRTYTSDEINAFVERPVGNSLAIYS